MKNLLLLIVVLLFSTNSYSQTSSDISGNKPSADYSAYIFDFNGGNDDNCYLTNDPMIDIYADDFNCDFLGNSILWDNGYFEGNGPDTVFINFSEGDCSAITLLDIANDIGEVEVYISSYCPNADGSGVGIGFHKGNEVLSSSIQHAVGSWGEYQSSTLTFTMNQLNDLSSYSDLEGIYLVYQNSQLGSGGVDIDWIQIGEEFVTGINSLQSDFNVSFYPNPASDFIKIEAKDIDNVKLFSIDGKLIQQWDGSNLNYIKLDTDLIKGLYMIQFSRGLESSIQKIVLN